MLLLMLLAIAGPAMAQQNGPNQDRKDRFDGVVFVVDEEDLFDEKESTEECDFDSEDFPSCILD